MAPADLMAPASGVEISPESMPERLARSTAVCRLHKPAARLTQNGLLAQAALADGTTDSGCVSISRVPVVGSDSSAKGINHNGPSGARMIRLAPAMSDAIGLSKSLERRSKGRFQRRDSMTERRAARTRW